MQRRSLFDGMVSNRCEVMELASQVLSTGKRRVYGQLIGKRIRHRAGLYHLLINHAIVV